MDWSRPFDRSQLDVRSAYDYLSQCVVCGAVARLKCRKCGEEAYCWKECKRKAWACHSKACGPFRDCVKAGIGRVRAYELANTDPILGGEEVCRWCGDGGIPTNPLYRTGCGCSNSSAHARCLPGYDCEECGRAFSGMAGIAKRFAEWFFEGKERIDFGLAELLAIAEEPTGLRVARRCFDAVKEDKTHRRYGEALDRLAHVALLLRKGNEAIRAYRALMAWRRRSFGPADRGTLFKASEFGTVLLVLGEMQETKEEQRALFLEAASLFRESISMQVDVKGLTHEETLPHAISLARALAQAGDVPRAESVCAAIRPTVEANFGPNEGMAIRLNSLQATLGRPPPRPRPEEEEED